MLIPSSLHRTKDILTPGTCVAIKGKLDIRNDEPSILVDRAKSLTPIQFSIDT
jgi:hypothetical protein